MEKINDEQLKRELPFDLYGRYAVIRDIINVNRKDNEAFRVLDVGGRGNLLKRFLPNDSVSYLDPLMESEDENFIKGDGCAMPLKDNSFDWVTSADVFEHIPKEKREVFLNENIRVAKKATILVAPFYSAEVVQAEANANENYKTLSRGKDHLWLVEHIENGLPDAVEFEKFLEMKKISFQKLYNNRLFLWQALINVSFLVFENFSVDIKEEFEDFNYFYNTEIFPYDNQEPSYRKIYFIKKDRNLKNIDTKTKAIDDVVFLNTIAKGFDLVNKINNLSKNSIQKKNKEITNLNQAVQQKEQEVTNLNQAVQQKDQEMAFMRSSKFWKLRERYVKIKGLKLQYIIDLSKKGLFILRRDGVFVFIKYIYKYLIHGREYFKLKISPSMQNYYLWIEKNEKFDTGEIKKEIAEFKYRPKISIITPVYNVDPQWLDKCIESVQNQFYQNWELCLHDDASSNEETIKCLKKWEKADTRIKVSFGKDNQHISGASNSALELAIGEFVALLDNDDELSLNALYEVVKLLQEHPEADFIYSDEDKLEMDGHRSDPFFKPDWSLYMFLSMNYTTHLSVYRKSIIDVIGGFRKGLEGSQDYDLVLRFIEKINERNIIHIPKILYHWRKIVGSTANRTDSKNYAYVAAKKAIFDYIERNNIKGVAEDGIFLSSYKIKRDLISYPLISIIIPTKDKVDYLKPCVTSVLNKTDYSNFEIIILDTGSKELETKKFYQDLIVEKRVRVIDYPKTEFNFAEANTWATQYAKGEYLLFLNNDTEVINTDWLSSMMEYAQLENVGIVGSKLLFPNNTIQHMGVVIGLRGGASHVGVCFPEWQLMSHPFLHAKDVVRNVTAVTGACLLIRREIFDKVGGFDKGFKIAFNDIDLCLKVGELGYETIYTPYAKLIHYESISFGRPYENKNRSTDFFEKERDVFNEKWNLDKFEDPFYNKNLTLKDESLNLRV